EAVLRDSLGLRQKAQAEAWTTFNTMSALGEALLGQKKYAAAQPLLVQGYEGMKEREASVPSEAKSRLTEALQSLVRLYEAWGKQEQAVEWRRKLEAQRQAENKNPPGVKP